MVTFPKAPLGCDNFQDFFIIANRLLSSQIPPPNSLLSSHLCPWLFTSKMMDSGSQVPHEHPKGIDNSIVPPPNTPRFLHSCITLYSYCLPSSKVKSLSPIQLFVTPRTVAYQVPLSLRFSRQEYWNRLPFPSPGDLPDPGIEPRSPALQADALLSEPPGKS